MLGGYLGYERESEGRDEELGHGHEEVVEDEHPGTGEEPGLGGFAESAELCAGGIAHIERVDGQEEVGDAGEPHADCNLAGSGNLFAFTRER